MIAPTTQPARDADEDWKEQLNADPRDWLLAEDTPAVRAAALRLLLGRPADDADVVAARSAAMRTDPILGILDAQEPDGSWGRPGPGYTPKYTGTGWQLFFLDQLGADPQDERIQRGCDYLLDQAPAGTGGLGTGVGGKAGGKPSPGSVFHCYNGIALRALIGFGRLTDPRVRAGLDWAARTVTGEGVDRFYAAGTNGPGFRCASNGGNPCAWGAVKELHAFARVPDGDRSPLVRRATEEGVAFLLSTDVATARYPTAGTDTPSANWFKLGFPSGYVTDVLQNLQTLADLGVAGDPRLAPALDWLRAQQDAQGRWSNRYALNGKTTVPIETQGKPSKWLTLRAISVLSAAAAQSRRR